MEKTPRKFFRIELNQLSGRYRFLLETLLFFHGSVAPHDAVRLTKRCHLIHPSDESFVICWDAFHFRFLHIFTPGSNWECRLKLKFYHNQFLRTTTAAILSELRNFWIA